MRKPDETHVHPVGNGTMLRYKFANGYGASVVQFTLDIGGAGSYGHEDGLWEMAVLKDGEICYDTPITDDVIGWLDDEGVDQYLARIEALPNG